MQTRGASEKTWFIWLIVSSLALLAVFQIVWLRKVWTEQREALRQEADNVFQRTVIDLQDSLTRRAMRRNGISPDSFKMRLPPPIPPEGFRRMMRQEEKVKTVVKRDSSIVHIRNIDTTQDQQVQIFITTTADFEGPRSEMLPGMDRLLLNWSGRAEGSKERFIFRVEKDTLDEAELRVQYTEGLRNAELPLDFQLLRFDEFQTIDSSLLATQPARAGLLTHQAYAAVFPDYQGFVFRKTLPYGLFSFLLFGVTAAAFGAIWSSLRRQQRLTKLKNDFIANITHELKTPITTVGVALEALSDFDARRDPERTREYLDISKLELERLSLLVDKVLRLSMFEQHEPRMRFETLDLADTVRQVLGALRLQAERLRAEIHFSPPPGAVFLVNGDRMHLSSVVFNLLDNALKYTRGVPVIHVVLEKNDTQVRLSIRDNGPGIAGEYQSRIFEKFFRVPAAANTHDVKGHGLGLSYAAQVARLHGGKIEVESVENDGSMFTLELPLAVG